MQYRFKDNAMCLCVLIMVTANKHVLRAMHIWIFIQHYANLVKDIFASLHDIYKTLTWQSYTCYLNSKTRAVKEYQA